MQRQRDIADAANALLARANATADAGLLEAREAVRLTKHANQVAERAAKAAEAANIQTAESVRAYVDAEKGRLYNKSIGLYPDGTIHHAWENIGRSPIIIQSTWRVSYTNTVGTPMSIGPKTIPLTPSNILMKPGGIIGSVRTESDPFVLWLTPHSASLTKEELEEVHEGRRFLFYCGCWVYITILGVRRCLKFTHVYMPEFKSFTSVDGKDFYDDFEFPEDVN